MRSAVLALVAGATLAPFSVSAQIYNYFGNGAIRSGVTTGSSTTTSREQVNTVSQTYAGSAYTATGENVIVMPNGPYGQLGPGSTYTIVNQGAPFQFSETWQPAGLVQLTTTGRTVDTQTLTNTMSVFSEIQ